MRECDFLIVGQGLAGTLLSHFLLNENQRIIVIDDFHKKAASKVAAGITNPITGRNYVKSWMVDHLIPFAKKTYESLEKQLNIEFYFENNILRTLHDQREQKNWFLKTATPGYGKYLSDGNDYAYLEEHLNPVYAIGEITQSSQTDIPVLLNAYRAFLKEKDLILEENFDFEQLVIKEYGIDYQGIRAKKILFCEGFKSAYNPYFSYLPFKLTKGEVLIIKTKKQILQKMFKKKIFLVPLSQSRYWAGSFYLNDFDKEGPSQDGYKELTKHLESILKVPFEIESHLSAVRPTVIDRRPFIGLHPELESLGIFNGLGTKGASLGPYFAHHFVQFLIHQTPLDKEINISRYQRFFKQSNS